MNEYNLYLKYSYKRINNHMILTLNLICGDLIYLRIFVPHKNTNLNMYCKMRFGNLMIWRVSLIYLQSVVQEILWGILGLIQQSFVLYRLQAWMKEAWEFFRELSCLKNLSWRKFCIFKNHSFFFFCLGWDPLFIEVCRGSQVLF
jgi:hypothetical protein